MADDELEVISAIARILSSSPASVEILPGAIEQWQTDPTDPFLFHDRNLGIPQTLLYRLYIVALTKFRRPRSTSSHQSLSEATAIVLFANPGHQTALNERKKLVVAEHLSPEREAEFIALLLSSSKNASKQSIIWDHRRWLLQKQALSPALIERELDIILKNCESYPRNYYAWAHWDFCMELLNGQTEYYLPVIVGAFRRLHAWIDSHLSDYSAAHHLCGLTQKFRDLDVEINLTRLSVHALELVSRYPDHEALWMYVRAVWTVGEDEQLRETLEASIASLPTSIYREQCIAWCREFK
ncbi:hypothetical protein D9757_006124 [Collybiopsis confluens]|uniref:Protein prenylyltransferase n=1 Tax=Collybiopsis confluens TaxID=2823264 RepID=A0A8H5HHF2_9AGAR|nr:hypothetical protein D9757_006124 [Collybiopsis confluens]